MIELNLIKEFYVQRSYTKKYKKQNNSMFDQFKFDIYLKMVLSSDRTSKKGAELTTRDY